VSLTAEPGWARLLTAARRRLERGGGDLTGTVSLTDPDEAERRVIIGVTGVYRGPQVGRLTVSLADLDQYLREATGRRLTETLAATAPLRDRPAELASENLARDAVLATAATCGHTDRDWYAQWLDDLTRDGGLTRIVRGGVNFVEVVRVLDALPTTAEPLPVFADRVLGDTKALDDGPVAALVLRALARWQGQPAPTSAGAVRMLWESVGLVRDDLASQVLVLNLRGGGGLLGGWLTEAARAGVPLRVTLHQLRREALTVACPTVFVCENPAVLRAAAERLGPDCAPLVCTEGVPSAAVHELLGATGDARIWWRNDFDWAGVRMTASALRRYRSARPWRMAATDYRAADGGVRLVGTAADAPWDRELAPAMVDRGRAVMEERLLPHLLADLGKCPP